MQHLALHPAVEARPPLAPHVNGEREEDPEEQGLFDPGGQEQAQGQGEPDDQRLDPGERPHVHQHARLHQPAHRGDHDPGQHRLRERRENAGEGKEQEHGEPRDCPRPARAGPGEVIQAAARQGAVDGHAPAHARHDVGRALGQELPVGAPARPVEGREAAGDGGGLGEAHQRDHDAGDDQGGQQSPGQPQADGRQRSRDVAHDRALVSGQRREEHAPEHGHERAREEGVDAAREQGDRDREHGERERGEVPRSRAAQHAQGVADEAALAHGGHSQRGRELGEQDEDGGPGGEPAHDGLRHQVGDLPGAHRRDHEPGQPHDEGQQGRRSGVGGAAGHGDGHEGAVGEQRGQGDGARLQVGTGREEARRQQRQRRGVEAMHAGQTRQLGVRHALGDDE